MNADARRHATSAAVRAPATLRHGRVGEHAADLGAAESPVQLLERHQGHAHVRHAAVDRSRREPERARAAAATGGQRRGEAHLRHAEHRRHLGGIARVRVDREAVEVLDFEAGVGERHQDRLARHRQLGLGERLAPLVVRRGADADDRRLVLDAHVVRTFALGQSPARSKWKILFAFPRGQAGARGTGWVSAGRAGDRARAHRARCAGSRSSRRRWCRPG